MNHTNMRTATFDEAVSFSKERWGFDDVTTTTNEIMVHECNPGTRAYIYLHEYVHDTGKEFIRLRIGCCHDCRETFINLKEDKA